MYSGAECECDCHDLLPGTPYAVRSLAVGAGGEGPCSKVNTITTDPIAPLQCPTPALAAKPKANILQLKWGQLFTLIANCIR